MILVIAGNQLEAAELADIMGWQRTEYVFIDHYRKMAGHRGSSVYIYGTGMQRSDFPAIEGFFYNNRMIVTDMNE